MSSDSRSTSGRTAAFSRNLELEALLKEEGCQLAIMDNRKKGLGRSPNAAIPCCTDYGAVAQWNHLIHAMAGELGDGSLSGQSALTVLSGAILSTTCNPFSRHGLIISAILEPGTPSSHPSTPYLRIETPNDQVGGQA